MRRSFLCWFSVVLPGVALEKFSHSPTRTTLDQQASADSIGGGLHGETSAADSSIQATPIFLRCVGVGRLMSHTNDLPANGPYSGVAMRPQGTPIGRKLAMTSKAVSSAFN